MSDPWSVLGVPRSASTDDIKKAYRKLVLEHHPDRLAKESESVKKTASVKFQAITEAYDILSDDTKRAAYRSQTNYNASTSHTSSGQQRPGYGYGSAYGYGSEYHAKGYTWEDVSRRSRPSLWHVFTRGFKQRPLEFTLMFALAGVAGFGVWGVEAYWHHRNRGRRFEDIQRVKLAAGGSGDGPGQAAAQQPSRSTSLLQQRLSYSASAHGASARLKPYGDSKEKEKELAVMSLSELVQLEERQAGDVDNRQQAPTADKPGVNAAGPREGPTGADGSRATQPGTQGKSDRPVDKTTGYRISPPGWMAGHVPASVASART